MEKKKEKNKMEKEKAIIHKEQSLHRLDISFLKHIDLEEYKKSHLLAYWIHDFSNYHDEERNFDCSKIKIFKRGNIVKANLGFNIGSELGGLHYCIVLNKHDNFKNGTLNVIPLTSKNKTYKGCINLGNEIFELLNENIKIEQDILYNLIEENGKSDITDEMLTKLGYIRKLSAEVNKMNQNSVALINQITTISKQRLFDIDILHKVKLSSSTLDKLDKAIIENFTK